MTSFAEGGLGQTWKMSKILPEQDFSFPNFTRKRMNYTNFTVVTKQRKLTAISMYTGWVTLPRLGNFIQAG